jgi:hypothetical protein
MAMLASMMNSLRLLQGALSVIGGACVVDVLSISMATYSQAGFTVFSSCRMTKQHA